MERTKFSDRWGHAPKAEVQGQDVSLVLGEWGRHAFREAAWAMLSPDEAREVARNLMTAANEAEMRRKARAAKSEQAA